MALQWFESRSGLPVERRFAKSETLRFVLEKAELETGQRLDEIKRAPRFPLSVVAAMELAVARDLDLPVGARVVLWARLIKLYGSLRMDDLQRLRPDKVNLTEGGLTGKLLRTKTSGPGKRTRELHLFIPSGVGIADVEWLKRGYVMWREVIDVDADFFLPRMSANMSTFTGRLATASDLAGMLLASLLLVRVPVFLAGGEIEFKEERFIEDCLAGALTGHSERGTFQSLLAGLGVAKAERQYLGRWSASGADEYVRTYKLMARRLLKNEGN